MKRFTLIACLLLSRHLKAQDTISHLERSANLKLYSAAAGALASIFAVASTKDDTHIMPASVFSITYIGLNVYSWIEFKRAGRAETKRIRQEQAKGKQK